MATTTDSATQALTKALLEAVETLKKNDSAHQGAYKDSKTAWAQAHETAQLEGLQEGLANLTEQVKLLTEQTKATRAELKRNETNLANQKVYDLLKELLGSSKRSTALLDSIQQKTSSDEYRNCYETVEIQAVIRFLEQWLRGNNGTLSKKHAEMLLLEIKTSKKLSGTTLDFQHYKNDERRRDHLVASLWERLRDDRHEMSPRHGQQGSLAIWVQGFRDEIRKHCGEDQFEELNLEPVPVDLEAMRGLCWPLNKAYQPVEPKRNERNLLTRVDRERDQEFKAWDLAGDASGTSKGEGGLWTKIPPQLLNIWKLKRAMAEITTSDELVFTEMCVELYQFFLVHQGAREAKEFKEYKTSKALEHEAGKESEAAKLAQTINIFAAAFPAEAKEIDEAGKTSPEMFKENLEHDQNSLGSFFERFMPEVSE